MGEVTSVLRYADWLASVSGSKNGERYV